VKTEDVRVVKSVCVKLYAVGRARDEWTDAAG
jgi:hypothetical protein